MSVHRKGAKWVGPVPRGRSQPLADLRPPARRRPASTPRSPVGASSAQLAALDAGRETLDEFVTQDLGAHIRGHARAEDAQHYANLYDCHISPDLGGLSLRELRRSGSRAGRPNDSRREPAGRRPAGARPAEHPAAARGRGRADRDEPRTARAARTAAAARGGAAARARDRRGDARGGVAPRRDAALRARLRGLRPSEALALPGATCAAQTLLVQRALSLGEDADTKTHQHRTVRLLAPLREDLEHWRRGRRRGTSSCSPATTASHGRCRPTSRGAGGPSGAPCDAAGIEHTTPYALRHSFASLLLHEGRSVIYVARQLGHDARLTLSRYGHVIDELDDSRESTRRRDPGPPRVPSEFPGGRERAAGCRTETPETRVEAAEPGRWS